MAMCRITTKILPLATLAGFLSRHRIVNFLPVKSLDYIKKVSNEIIRRRKEKIDVIIHKKKFILILNLNKKKLNFNIEKRRFHPIHD